MRAEAGVDEGVLHRLGIEHRHLARRPLEREHLGRRMIGALLAEVPGCPCRAPSPRATPGPSCRTWRCGCWPACPRSSRRPSRAKAAVGLTARGMSGPERFRHVRILHRHLEERHLVRLRIEDRHVVGRVFGRAVERPVGIDGRIAPVRGDQVVQVMLVGAPLPGGDDDVALDALRPRRLALRQLALGDAIGPVAEILERHAAELSGDAVGHHLAGLAGLDAAHPGFCP